MHKEILTVDLFKVEFNEARKNRMKKGIQIIMSILKVEKLLLCGICYIDWI